MNIKIICIVVLCAAFSLSSYAQSVFTTPEGYGAISAEGMPIGSYETRSATFAINGRIKRHIIKNESNASDPNNRISAKFAISPPLKKADKINPLEITWAEASGWHTNANGTPYDAEALTENTGCPMYTGMMGTDPVGTWRLPTQREMMLVWIFLDYFKTITSFEFSKTITSWKTHWTATEDNASHAITVKLTNVNTGGGNTSTTAKTSATIFVRCVKDLP